MDFKKYKYIGMPFHAVGFPQPVYSHLMGSNDGVNWDDLKSYNFGWRDTDIAYINGEFWTCTGTYVNHTTDFESFTQINCPSMGLKNLWASEFFQAPDGQWYFVYCGSVTDVDYSQYKLYASKVYPENHQIDGTRMDITLNASGGYIDPNINYINGKYYLWCSKTSTPTQELHLFKSDRILGPYNEVPTNIMTLVNQTGFTWDEAPEMLQVDGKYYLYSDPWNKGESESDRDIYRCESMDLMNWSNMQRCNADVTMRHFTPLDIQGLFGANNGNTPVNPPTPQPQPVPTPTPTPEKPSDDDKDDSNLSVINLWNGDVNVFLKNNHNNYLVINKFISDWNKSDNMMLEPIEFTLDATKYPEINRDAYDQFINNANTLIQELPKLVESYRFTDFDYECIPPNVPKKLNFNLSDINSFWKWVNDTINWIENQIKQVI